MGKSPMLKRPRKNGPIVQVFRLTVASSFMHNNTTQL